MTSSSNSLPRLATETWIEILTEHGLSYHDLKRVSGVSKELRLKAESTPFDALLFRGPEPVATLTEKHPVLIAGWSFIGNSL